MRRATKIFSAGRADVSDSRSSCGASGEYVRGHPVKSEILFRNCRLALRVYLGTIVFSRLDLRTLVVIIFI
jgi:hypothetical protein